MAWTGCKVKRRFLARWKPFVSDRNKRRGLCFNCYGDGSANNMLDLASRELQQTRKIAWDGEGKDVREGGDDKDDVDDISGVDAHAKGLAKCLSLFRCMNKAFRDSNDTLHKRH